MNVGLFPPRLLLFFAIALLPSIGKTQVCNKSQLPANLQSGLVAFYPFCGNANDVSGNGNNGTVLGGTILTTDRFNNPNSAYQFPGNSSSYISVAGAPILQINGPITISFWGLMDGGTFNPRAIEFGDGSSGYRIGPAGTSNTSRIINMVYSNSSVSCTASALVWNHFVMTVDAQGNHKAFLNGVLQSSVSGISISSNIYTGNLNIGRKPFSANDAWGGKIDDILIYNRALGDCEILQLYNATASGLPVVQSFTFNPLSDTTRVCSNTTTLDAGAGFASYQWNNGATTRTISVTSGGVYKVTVTNAAGCTASDSTLLSLVTANIINNDTTICKGASITLSIDSLFTGRTVCTAAGLPTNLRNGLVGYWPFCGSANDESGNGNNGTVNGAVLTTDRFGNPNGAYAFNNSYLVIPNTPAFNAYNFTVSFWIKSTSTSRQFPISRLNYADASGENYVFGINDLAPNGVEFAVKYNNPTCLRGFGWQRNEKVLNILDNRYHHIVGTVSGPEIKLYVDGILAQTITTAYPQSSACWSGALQLGRNWANDPGNFIGSLDDLMIYNRPLQSSEVAQLFNQQNVTWSTGATTNTITVSPNQTTTYYVTVSDGITTCTDSVKVTVADIGTFNPLSDTTRVCGKSTTLDAGAGFTTYQWNNGATTRSITVTSGGLYKVTVTNAAGCSGSDSTLLSLVNASIINNDTTICKGASITLSIDSIFSGRTACAISELPVNLRTGLVGYWPFCGNTNDITGNGGNGLTGNVSLTSDRRNQPNAAYYFSGSASSITIPMNAQLNVIGNRTISCWYRPVGPQTGGRLFEYSNYNSGAGMYGGNTLDVWHCSGGFDQNIVGINAGALNNWHYLTYTTNAVTREGKLYIDGVLVGTRIGAAATCNNNWVGQFISLGRGNAGESFVGDLDDVAIWSRELSSLEVSQLFNQQNVTWSTGATTNSITVSPTQTTTYYVTVSDGITSCTDSVKVTVSDIGTFNPLSDTTRVCGKTATLDAGAGFASYQWSTGATTQTITATSSGVYKVTVTNAAGCSASDSTLLSLVNADILNNDTTICTGASLTLRVDTTFPGRTACNVTDLQANLRNGLLAYWPFCGNLNDVSGNGKHGTNFGAIPATDRFGIPARAMAFNLPTITGQYISVPALNVSAAGSTGMTLSMWFKRMPLSSNISTLFRQEGSCNFPDFLIQSHATAIQTGIRTSGYSSTVTSYAVDTSWCMITMTYDNAQLRTYLNGSLISTEPKSGAVSFLESISTIGICGSLIDHRFSGYIDDISVWNRPLSPAEISTLQTGNRNSSVQYLWSTGATTPTINIQPTQTTTYYVTVTDGNFSCTDSIKVTVNNLAGFNPLSDTTRVCGKTTTLDAGPGFASYQWNTGATTQTITATSGGVYKVTVTNAAGCSASDSTLLSLVNANIINNDTTICKGSSISLFVDSTNSSGSSQLYIATFFNRWTHDFVTQVGRAYKLRVTGTWRIGGSPNQLYDAAYYINSQTPLPPFSCSSTLTQFAGIWYRNLCGLRPTPDVYNPSNFYEFLFIANDTLTSIGFDDFGNYGDNVGSLIYELLPATPNNSVLWSTGATTNSITVSPIQTTTYYVTVSDGITTCTDSVKVTVSAVDTAVTALDPTAICSATGGQVRLQANAVGAGITYQWLFNGSAIPNSNVRIYTATQSGNYRVVIINTLGCSDTSRIIPINLVQTPSANTVSNRTLCNGQSSTAISITGSVTGTVYNWTNSNPSIGLGASGVGDIPTFTAVNTGTSPITATITVTPTNTVSGLTCTGTPITFTITVNPSARVNPVSNQTICSGASTTGITLGTTNTGGVSTYTWTIISPAGLAGLPGSGTGSIPVMTPINLGTTPLTATITITPTYTSGGVTCSGTPIIVTITVNPTPTVSTVSNQVVCSGAITTAVTFTSSVTGTTYNWVNNTPSIGLGASGTGNIPSFTASNTTSAPVTATITVTPSFTNNGVACSGTPRTFSITVNPVPTGAATPAAQTICSGSSITPISFSAAAPGTVFTWTRDNATTVTGIPSSGTGNISGSLTNNTSAPTVVTFTVVPTLTNVGVACAGTPFTVVVLVNPIPTATTTPLAQTICSGNAITSIITTSGVGGVVYSWTRDNTTAVTGIGASGTGVISGSLTNTTNAPVTVSFTITPSANGCAGAPSVATVLVNPIPTALAVPATQSICSGNSINPITISGGISGTSFTWTRDNTGTVTGIPASGTGNISGSLTNNSLSPVLVTFTIQPVANTCQGIAVTNTVLVNPKPTGTLTAPSNIICEGSSVLLTATGGSTYQWFLDGQLISGATGATYGATQAGTYTVQLISAAGCTTTLANSVVLTRITKPIAAFSFDKYCAGVITQFTNQSTVSGSGTVTYAWNFGNGATSPLQNPAYTYASAGSYAVTLTVTPTACPSLASVATQLIQVQSAPASQRYPAVNAVENRNLTLQARSITNATYNWAPAQGLNRTDIRTPVFNYGQQQEYLISIQTPEGCFIRDTLLVRMFKQADILLPTGFSPNGDGHNDLLIPRLVGVSELKYFRVYDRWGQLVYQTDVIGRGWDGTYKGVKQPLETYAWVAEGIAVDGSAIKRSGTTLLLR